MNIKENIIVVFALIGLCFFMVVVVPLLWIIQKIEWFLKGWLFLKEGSTCPECNKGIMYLHGYGEFGGHILECPKCHFRLDGVDE